MNEDHAVVQKWNFRAIIDEAGEGFVGKGKLKESTLNEAPCSKV